MVSPQHPCEVGWKVATIVMPTSQTRPGHRGKHTRDGLARQGGPSPLSGLPFIPAEPGPPATHSYLDMEDKDGGKKKKKNKKRTKPKIVMLRRGKKIDIFFPSGQILSEQVQQPVWHPAQSPHPAPTRDTPAVQSSTFAAGAPSTRQRRTTVATGGASSVSLCTHRALPSGGAARLWETLATSPRLASRAHPAGERVSGATH